MQMKSSQMKRVGFLMYGPNNGSYDWNFLGAEVIPYNCHLGKK